MYKPAHTGELLSGWLSELSLSVTAFAEHIGTRRVMVPRDLWSAGQSAKSRNRIGRVTA